MLGIFFGDPNPGSPVSFGWLAAGARTGHWTMAGAWGDGWLQTSTAGFNGMNHETWWIMVDQAFKTCIFFMDLMDVQ